MEIQKFKISGFKNVSEVSLSLNNITALVGLNGYGKSNIIDAIEFGIDFIKAPATYKTSLMSRKNYIPILKANAGKDFSFGMNFSTTTNGQIYEIIYGYSFRWETNTTKAGIISEYLEMKTSDKNQRYASFITRTKDTAKYRPSETSRCIKEIKTDENNLIINKLSALDDLYYLDIVKQINNINFFKERHLDASPSYLPDPFIIKGFNELELKGIQSIPRAVFFLKKDYPDKFDLLSNAFMQLFPDIKDITVNEIKLNSNHDMKINEDAPFVFTDSIYIINILDDKLLQPISFENLSDGTKRIFLMLTFAVIADIRHFPVIAIEEPENSIHPTLFQDYLNVLSQLVNDCKIILTSHSPYIIQYLDPKNLYVGMMKPSREVDFRRIASSKVNSLLRDASDYDKSVGDYIFNLLSSANAEEELDEYLEK